MSPLSIIERKQTPIRWGSSTVEFSVLCCCIVAVVVATANVLSTYALDSFGSVYAIQSSGELTISSPEDNTHYIPPRRIDWLDWLLFALIGLLGTELYLLRRRHRTDQNTSVPSEDDVSSAMGEPRSQVLCKILAKRNEIFSRLEGSWEELINGHAVVETYMSRDVFSVEPEMTSTDAFEELQSHGYRRCMVTDSEGRLVGVVSKKDIISKSGRTVGDVMTNNPRIANLGTELHIALSVLLENRISCLPVVNRGFLVGIISTSDLLMVLQCLLIEVHAHANIESKSDVNKVPQSISVGGTDAGVN